MQHYPRTIAAWVSPLPDLTHGSCLKDTRTNYSKVSGQTKPQHLPEAWIVVDKELSETVDDRNSKHVFWWHSTGIRFAVPLEKAGYLFEKQLQNLRFYSGVIVPELGHGPRQDGTPKHWQSFMTDHHSPVEFSWAWNCGTELPVVRFSFEPIGEAGGTRMDPNNQYAAPRFVADQHRQIQGSDLAWFNHMWKTLVHFDEPHGSTRPTGARLPGISEPSQTHKSRAFLAVEFNKAGPMLKTYYMPGFKSAAVGHSTMAVINNTIAGLPSLSLGVRNGHKRHIEFLDLTHKGQSLTPEIVATDCIAPEKSRIKIYMRSQSTSLESVIETLCLGDPATRER